MVWGLEKGSRDGVTVSSETEKLGFQEAIKSTNGHCDVYINWSIMAYIKVMNQPKMYRSILEKI